jgi:precorrin-4 methylase
MKSDQALRDIPVVVLMVSEFDKEMLASYGVPASCFVTKPLTLDKYLDALRCYSQFGLSIVRLHPTPN